MTGVEGALERVRAAGFTVLYGYVKGGRAAPVELDVDLDDLLALPQLHVPVIFYEQDALEPWDFEAPPGDGPGATPWDAPADPAPVNLAKFTPELQRFRSRLGEVHTLTLRAPLSGVLVSCTVVAAWHAEFAQLRAQALGQVHAQAQATKETERAAQTAEQARHDQRLRLLMDDSGFLKLARLKNTAQRTLLTYARTHAGEAVDALGEARTKEVLAELRDLVLMQKLDG